MDRRVALMLVVAVLVCLPFAGEAFGQCPGGTCRPVQKAVTKTLDGVKSVVVKRAVVQRVARRGVLRKIFARR